jgi:hypothetical protein
MARSVGIPARVAVGFTYGTRIGPDTYQVTNQQLHAWPEVWLSGLGWTAFEPTPKGDAPGQTPNSPGAQTGEAPAGTQAPATTAATNRPGAPATTAVAPTTLGSKPADDPTPAWVWAVAAIPVALAIGAAAFAIAVTAAKRRRERRRRARPDTRDAVAGAWAEAVDRLQESGRVVRPDLTPLELAGDASTREPEQLSGLLLVLARSYTAASCSPRRPEPEAVTEAWGAVDELGRYLERSVGPAVRWRRRLDPRTIWRRRTRRASCTRPSGWCQSADGRVASEGAVASVIVVVVEPGCKGVGPVVVAGEHARVGPLDLEGPVEAFDFAVLPGAVRSDEFVFDVVSGEQGGEGVGAGVAPVIVGHDRGDGDAVEREAVEGAGEERGAGGGGFVGEDLGVRSPAVVVDDGMDVVEPDPGFLLGGG